MIKTIILAVSILYLSSCSLFSYTNKTTSEYIEIYKTENKRNNIRIPFMISGRRGNIHSPFSVPEYKEVESELWLNLDIKKEKHILKNRIFCVYRDISDNCNFRMLNGEITFTKSHVTINLTNKNYKFLNKEYTIKWITK